MIVKRIAVIIALFAPVAAAEESSRSAFYEESVLREALSDISQMPEAEVRAFIRYFSECDDNSGEVGRHFCNSALSSYETEYGNDRAIDHFIYARSFHEKAPPDPTKPRDTEHLVAEAKVHAKILSAIQHAVRDRLRTLKASQK
jgi:hypothetical protein